MRVPTPQLELERTPGGLLVPAEFAKAVAVARRDDEVRRIDRRVFSSYKTAKFYSSFGHMGNSATAGTQDKPRNTIPFTALRQMFEQSPLDQAVISARLHQMRYVTRRALIPSKETGWRVMSKRAADPNFENDDTTEARCREVEAVIERVNRKIMPGGLRGFLTSCVRDQLVFDRKVMILAHIGEGSQRKPYGYWTVDPATVKPRIEVLAPWMMKNRQVRTWSEAAERMTYEMAAKGAKTADGKDIDLTTAAYVQEIEGQITAAWTEDEIDIDITNPRNEIDQYFYGRSLFEESLPLSVAFNAAFKYNTGWFQSRVPEQMISITGEYDDDGLDVFQKQVLGQGSPADFHRVAVVTGGDDFKMQALPLRASMREMAFPAWIRLLIALKCAHFRLDPRIINFDLATGNDQQMWKSSSRELQITLSQEEGFHTIIMDMEAWYNRTIVEPMYPDLVMRWVGLDRPSDPDMAELLSNKLNWESLDEVRAETGSLQPLAVPGYPELGKLPLNPALLSYLTTLMQMRMMQMQASQSASQASFLQGGGQTAPAQADEESAPASASSSPGGAGGAVSPGDVERQAGGMAGGMQKSHSRVITVEVQEVPSSP